MTCATVAFPQAVAFDGRAFALRDCHRVIFGGVVIGLGTMAAACAMVACVTVAAAWIVAASLSANPYIHPSVSMGPETIALNYRYPILAGAPDVSASAPLPVDHGYAPDPLLEAELTLTPTPSFAPANAAPLLTNRFTRRADHVPSVLLTPAPIQAAHAHAPDPTVDADLTRAAAPNSAPTRHATVPTAHISEPARTREAVPQIQAAPAMPPASSSHKPLPSPQAHRDLISMPGTDSHTAVYDIEAHTVYLPGGDRLEAHSGLGKRLDDPRYVSEKNRGPTPPNVYDLVLRSDLSTAFGPFASIRLVKATCSVAMVCSRIPTCLDPAVSRLVAYPSETIMHSCKPFWRVRSIVSSSCRMWGPRFHAPLPFVTDVPIDMPPIMGDA